MTMVPSTTLMTFVTNKPPYNAATAKTETETETEAAATFMLYSMVEHIDRVLLLRLCYHRKEEVAVQ